MGLFLFFSACSIALSRTILSFCLNPAYIAQDNQYKLTKLATTLETLEHQNEEQQKFISLLQQVIAGEEVEHPMAPLIDTTPAALSQQQVASVPEATLPIDEEALQTPMAADDDDLSSSSGASTSTTELQDVLLFPPVQGIITTPFKKQAAHYGVDIVAKAQEPIKCIADGIVVLAEYTLATGWVIIVQHRKNLVSVYKHNASLFKKVGSFVDAGDIIAIMGNSGELSSGPHLHFELWYKGNPVDPEHFIAF